MELKEVSVFGNTAGVLPEYGNSDGKSATRVGQLAFMHGDACVGRHVRLLRKRGIRMDRNSTDFKMLVYDLMSGSIDLENHPVEESRYVKNAYEEGSDCDQAYAKAIEACERLGKRLGTPEGEDPDVECIMNSMLKIQEILCMKMYEYGWFFAKNEKES